MNLHNRHTIDKDIKYTYIGRATPWGNPYVVNEEMTRSEAAAMYRKKLARELAAKHPPAVKLVLDLAGTLDIACSCSPKECHGDCFKEIWDIIRGKQVTPLEGIRLWVKENGFDAGPHSDGINHINIYSRGKTKLGRFLTNMSNVPVKTKHGVFESMEGYWYWLSTGKKHDQFKEANCFEAKKIGRTMERVSVDRFQDDIKEAMEDKLKQYPRMLEDFKKSTLPFKHYYFYGDSDDRTVIYPPFDWLTIEWERLRKKYRGELKSCIIAGSRDITDEAVVKKAIIDSGFVFDEVVSGTARGVDTLGELYAKRTKKYIKRFWPEWDELGKKAGILRNIDMGNYADMAVIVIKNGSKGSTQMKDYMLSLGKPVFVVELNE